MTQARAYVSQGLHDLQQRCVDDRLIQHQLLSTAVAVAPTRSNPLTFSVTCHIMHVGVDWL